jgi:hypothetical protein
MLFPIVMLAQNGIITGKVSQKGNSFPVARASVFLGNSSYGTSTSETGTFTLNNVKPGQYTLVVTVLGYEDYTQTILVTGAPIKLAIELAPKTIVLRDVVISSSSEADWNRNYAQFKKEFIGTDENAKNCEVINPHILDFTYYKTQQVLEASADEFLIVENRALGYRVKFLVKSFKSDKIAGIIQYEGQRLFQELPGKASQKKKWMAKRNEAYYGSAMHFYRSLYKGKLTEEGFEMYRLTRYLNPERPQEEIIQRNISRYMQLRNRDSVNKWVERENLSKYFRQYLGAAEWLPFEILRTTQQPGIYAVTFPDCLYVMYTKKREPTYFRDLYRPLNMPNYETSVVSFFDKSMSYYLFDLNGIVVGPSPLYEGTWSKSTLSQMLPVDYEPTDDK